MKHQMFLAQDTARDRWHTVEVCTASGMPTRLSRLSSISALEMILQLIEELLRLRNPKTSFNRSNQQKGPFETLKIWLRRIAFSFG